jgi:hypothetical protein
MSAPVVRVVVELAAAAVGASVLPVPVGCWVGEHGERSEPRAAGRRPKAALEHVRNVGHDSRWIGRYTGCGRRDKRKMA